MTATLTMYRPSEPSLLRFGTWSLFLHLFVFLVLSMVHLEHNLKEKSPVVKVTLIENPTVKPKPEKESSGARPLMTTRPPIASPKPTPLPSPIHSGLPEPPLAIAKFVPPPPTPASTPQAERPVLRDFHATDALNLQNFLKTPQRTGNTTTSTAVPSLLDMPALPPTMAVDVPSITTVPHRSPPPIFSQSAQTSVLTATPSGSNGIARSKVGLGKTIPPVYPRIARESGWEGTVVVRVVVQADGTPDIIQVRKSSGHQVLDDAATDALKNWQFVPAKDGNIPIRSIVEIPINFDLRKQG